MLISLVFLGILIGIFGRDGPLIVNGKKTSEKTSEKKHALL
jgi:hypothetical protein